MASKLKVILGIMLSLSTLALLALAAATLVVSIKQYDDLKNMINALTGTQNNSSSSTVNPPSTGSTTALPQASSLIESTRIQDVMAHLRQMQRLATEYNETRAIGTQGFNRTLDYIIAALRNNTNYNLNQTFFTVRQFAIANDPTFQAIFNASYTVTYNYSTTLSLADFYFVRYSTGVNLTTPVRLSVIPNVGCTRDDWEAARAAAGGTLTDRVVLVKRGTCTFREKGAFAANYSVKAILFYNHGNTPSDVHPIEVSLGQDQFIPALFLSSKLGNELARATDSLSNIINVRMTISVQNLPNTPVGNICADTPSGNASQTIVIGSHSDSVPAGPGINDNGSGSAANLALAIALARLFETSTYPTYKYRVRFCWWGAEEVGLLGSDDHVKKAKLATTVGDRIQDYLINLNYDMLGSPNYIFGIYDGRTAPNTTDRRAVIGSNKISALFRDWFIDHDLPWDYTDFSGRSDYGPFLAAGIVAGGLFSGADELKTEEQKTRYDRMLGGGRGGTANITQDPCYHKLCDSIQNIDVFGHEKMVQAAAYVLEYLGRLDDLEAWLYPEGRPSYRSVEEEHKYDSVNEYFRLPYF